MRWHTADFDTLDWQGVHVHGWRIVERGPGEADLALDIDWILDRLPSADAGEGRRAATHSDHAAGRDADPDADYIVAQAMLVFHDVAALRFLVDFAACSAASGPFAIQRVQRASTAVSGPEGDEDVVDEDADADADAERAHASIAEDYGPWGWRIDLAWPEGELVFEASGFSQWLVGEPQVLDGPVLPAALRS